MEDRLIIQFTLCKGKSVDGKWITGLYKDSTTLSTNSGDIKVELGTVCQSTRIMIGGTRIFENDVLLDKNTNRRGKVIYKQNIYGNWMVKFFDDGKLTPLKAKGDNNRFEVTTDIVLD